MTALVANYHDRAPRALLWLPGDRVQVLDAAEDVPAMTAVACVRPHGEAFVAGVTDDGTVLLHGAIDTEVRHVGATMGPPVRDLPPVAVCTPSGHWQLAVPVQGPDDLGHAVELWDLRVGGSEGAGRELCHDGTWLTHLLPLTRPDQDLVVAACEDATLRVWNPTRPERAPLTVPLPGTVTDLTAAAPDLVYALIDEHWFALRLTGLGPLLSG
jgi:hypothetical protein